MMIRVCLLCGLQESLVSHKAKWANHIATLTGSGEGRLTRSVRGYQVIKLPH